MSDAGEIAPLIEGLCDADPSKRLNAAAELFALGSALANAAIRNWLIDGELMNCLIGDRASSLAFTVGIAVRPVTFDRVHRANESPRLSDVPPEQDAIEFELQFPGGVRLDILTTREPEGSGAIARYLGKFSEGIQQVEIDATDVDRATAILRDRFGVAPIYPVTRAGADGTRVNFFLAPAAEGKKALIELVERD